MFDIGFWELTLLGVIGLIVLGPERLPVVARTLGQWVGRAKGYMRGLTNELEREVRVDDIRGEVRRAREQIESDTRSAVDPARESLPPDPPSLMSGPDKSQPQDDDERPPSPSASDAAHDKSE